MHVMNKGSSILNKLGGGAIVDDNSTQKMWVKQIYDQNYLLLHNVGYDLTAGNPLLRQQVDDVMQETFLLLYEKADSLQEHPNISGWLVKTFKNKLRKAWEKQRQDALHMSYSLDDDKRKEHPLIWNDSGFQSTLSVKDYDDTLKKLLGEENAIICEEYIVHNEPTADVAERHGLTINALWVRINRIKQKLSKNRDRFLE